MSRIRFFKLTSIMAILAVMSFGFTADTASHSNITAPAAATCTGVASVSATSGDQPGITFPVTDAGAEDPRDFDWSLDAFCEVAVDGGATVYTNVPLNVSGTANGYCGASTADSGSGTIGDSATTGGAVNISNITWESAGSMLVVSLNHDAEGPAATGEGAAEVNAQGGQDCSTHAGATSFDVVIEGQFL